MSLDGVRCVVPADRIARVIGKAGAGLRQIRESSGCKVVVGEEQVQGLDRHVSLIGSATGIATAFSILLSKAYAGDVALLESVSVLIPAELAGKVIGKGGAGLKKVREATGVRMQVESNTTMNPADGTQERLVSLSGGAISQLSQALHIALGGASLGTSNLGYMPSMPPGLMAQMPQLFAGMPNLAMMPGNLSGSLLTHVRKFEHHDPEEMQLHLVVFGSYAGSLLGKGGAQMKQTALMSGCRINMTNRDASPDRRVVMIGSYDQCALAQQMLVDQLKQAATAAGRGLGDITVILLIRREAAGALIGKQGLMIKQVREQSGATVTFAREEIEGQRPCQLTGTLENVLAAEKLIFDVVKAVPLSGSGATIETHNL